MTLGDGQGTSPSTQGPPGRHSPAPVWSGAAGLGDALAEDRRTPGVVSQDSSDSRTDWSIVVDLISAYGIFPIGALFLVGWLLPTAAAPSGSVGGHLEPLASRMVATLIAMVLLAVGVKVAGMVWADPRPFQIDPSIHPSIAHATDNGFVSDHSALAAALSGLVSAWRRHLGAVMLGL